MINLDHLIDLSQYKRVMAKQMMNESAVDVIDSALLHHEKEMESKENAAVETGI